MKKKCPAKMQTILVYEDALKPEFTKEVCRQTEVYVRHMTRFDAFKKNLVVKNKRRFVDKRPL